MHVLGTPPAFILSQDQTLHRNCRGPINLDDHYGSLSPHHSSIVKAPIATFGSHRSLAARTLIVPGPRPCRQGPRASPRKQKTQATSCDLGFPDTGPKRHRRRPLPSSTILAARSRLFDCRAVSRPVSGIFCSAPSSGVHPRGSCYGNRSALGVSRARIAS